jgi:hypothetical protein
MFLLSPYSSEKLLSRRQFRRSLPISLIVGGIPCNYPLKGNIGAGWRFNRGKFSPCHDMGAG